jgi:hypothetical protein
MPSRSEKYDAKLNQGKAASDFKQSRKQLDLTQGIEPEEGS